MPARELALLGLDSVIVRRRLAPMAVAVGLKLLAITGASKTRVSAVAGALSVVVSVESMTLRPM